MWRVGSFQFEWFGNVSVVFVELYFSNMSKWYVLFYVDPADRVLFRYDRGCSSCGLHLAGKMVCSPLVRWRVTPNSEDW